MITNYTTLQAAVQDWLWNRADVTSALVQTWIALAEAQMNRRLRSRLKTAVNSAFSIGAEFVNVPADFAGAVSIKIQSDPTVELSNKMPDGIANLWSERSSSDTTGKPFAYAVVGSQFQFFRVPDQTYTATLIYRQQIPPLASNATNWLLTNHPDAYLYGTLLQSAPWLKNDERVPLWENAFGQILDDIMDADKVETMAAHMTPHVLMVV